MIELVTNQIVVWSGSIATIPAGYALCDGNNGTPNLLNYFMLGAGGTKNPGDTGGGNTHTHLYAPGSHRHSLLSGANISLGFGRNDYTDTQIDPGDTSYDSRTPPYWALAFIMKV